MNRPKEKKIGLEIRIRGSQMARITKDNEKQIKTRTDQMITNRG